MFFFCLFLFYILDFLVCFLLKKEFWCLKTKNENFKSRKPLSIVCFLFLPGGRGEAQLEHNSDCGCVGTLSTRTMYCDKDHTENLLPQPSGRRSTAWKDAFEIFSFQVFLLKYWNKPNPPLHFFFCCLWLFLFYLWMKIKIKKKEIPAISAIVCFTTRVSLYKAVLWLLGSHEILICQRDCVLVWSPARACRFRAAWGWGILPQQLLCYQNLRATSLYDSHSLHFHSFWHSVKTVFKKDKIMCR